MDRTPHYPDDGLCTRHRGPVPHRVLIRPELRTAPESPYLIEGWEIAVILIVAYAAIVVALYRRGWIGRDKTLSLFGPALMIKTVRGREFIARVGRRERAWSIAADVGLILSIGAMVVIVGLLLFDAVVALSVPASAAPPVTEALGIPGINPIIPITYGILALVVGVVVHELFHGFVARSQKIRVKSLGILYCVIPIGAFVEQDDDDMTKAPRRQRDRVAAAGILANFALFLLFALLLSAFMAAFAVPNATGPGIAYVVPGTPAANVSLVAGDIITAVNGTPTPTNVALFDALSLTRANQSVALAYYSPTLGAVTTHVTLADLGAYNGIAADRGKGFLGVSPTFLTPVQLHATLVNPLTSSSTPLVGLTDWLVLPLAGLQPISGSTQSFYHLTGPFAGLDPSWFWIGINILYWLAWMDLLLGLSNALPLFPLDGGLLFRDFMASIAARLRRGWSEARLDQFSGRAVAASSLLVVFLIVWQFVAPHL